MKEGLIILMTFFIFYSDGYSQETMLLIVGKQVSVSQAKRSPLQIDTMLNVKLANINGDVETIDTMLMLKIIDNKNIAVYEILKLINGDFKKDIINFIFHNRSHVVSSNDVLLFLTKDIKDKYYTLKRQPVEVYKTKDNRWASPYIVEMNKYSQTKFHKIKFEPELVFDISDYDDKYIEEHYPSPYYKIKNRKACAAQGIYVEELSTLLFID